MSDKNTQRKQIRLAYPQFTDQVKSELYSVLESGWLTKGPYITKFEAQLSQMLGGLEVVTTASGSAALRLAFCMLRSNEYRRAIIPAYSFPAAAFAAVENGFEVWLCSVGKERLDPDLEALDSIPADQYTVLVSIDQFGIPAQNDVYQTVAAKKGWFFLEDAACALGSRQQDQTWCGTAADLAVFSFHPRKVVTTAEGGAIVTKNSTMAERLRRLRDYGSLSGTKPGEFYSSIGFNARMSELHAVLGLDQLRTLESRISLRKTLGQTYIKQLRKIEQVSIPEGLEQTDCNFQSMVVSLHGLQLPQGTIRVLNQLKQWGVEATWGATALPLEPGFRTCKTFGDINQTIKIAYSTVVLPLHERMTKADVTTVVQYLSNALSVETYRESREKK